MINIIALISIIIIVVVGSEGGGEVFVFFGYKYWIICVITHLQDQKIADCCNFPYITVLYLIMYITVYQSVSQIGGTTYLVSLCTILCCLLHFLLPHHQCLHNVVSPFRYNYDIVYALWFFDHMRDVIRFERISDLTTSS